MGAAIVSTAVMPLNQKGLADITEEEEEEAKMI